MRFLSLLLRVQGANKQLVIIPVSQKALKAALDGTLGLMSGSLLRYQVLHTRRPLTQSDF